MKGETPASFIKTKTVILQTMDIRFFPGMKNMEGVTLNFGISCRITYQPSPSQPFQAQCPHRTAAFHVSVAHDPCYPRGTRHGRIRGPATLWVSGACSGLCSWARRKNGVPGPEGKSPFPAPGTRPVSQLALYFGFSSGLLFSAECPLAGLPTSD